MTKKQFIALANAIREYNDCMERDENHPYFTDGQLDMLADFCKSQNTAFKRDRWLMYIAGECGPNGGNIK